MLRFLLALTGTAVALAALLSFKSHSLATDAPPAAVAPVVPGGGTPSTSGSSSSASPSSTSGTSGTRTVTGDSADTRWGPVQVQLTVTGGKVTAVQAVVYPNENPRDQEINAYAIPELNSEAVRAGSADIDSVSGATVTSDGYKQSLQSALDRAGL